LTQGGDAPRRSLIGSAAAVALPQVPLRVRYMSIDFCYRIMRSGGLIGGSSFHTLVTELADAMADTREAVAKTLGLDEILYGTPAFDQAVPYTAIYAIGHTPYTIRWSGF
jgi:hypothetical protein